VLRIFSIWHKTIVASPRSLLIKGVERWSVEIWIKALIRRSHLMTVVPVLQPSDC